MVAKSFQEFLNKGTVKRQSPDRSRADFLIKESEKSYLTLKNIIKSISITNENANSIIKLSYDIIMELIRSKMLLKGFSSSGTGAHEAETSFLRELNFSEIEVRFVDQLRYFRNGIVYYGKVFDEEYAKKVVDFVEKLKKRLR